MISLRCFLPLVALLLAVCGMRCAATVVVDAVSRKPLSGVSVISGAGKPVALGSSRGLLPSVSEEDYPVTLHYMGYADCVVEHPGADTVAMRRRVIELRPAVVSTSLQRVLSLTAYVREYSTLSSRSDTVFLFREKMVDFLLAPAGKSRVKGWTLPRILASKSYYRFTNSAGLDSVSDRCSHYFSWADWIGVPPAMVQPQPLCDAVAAVDTLRGRYQPCEVWSKDYDRVTVNVDVMADTIGRRWVPGLARFFTDDIDFWQLRTRFLFENVPDDEVDPSSLSGFSADIESDGRGHGMFMFGRPDRNIGVVTHAEVYIVDKKYLTVGEARKLAKPRAGVDTIAVTPPAGIEPLPAAIEELVARVEGIDADGVRVALPADLRLVRRFDPAPRNLGYRTLQLFKNLLGISSYRANRQWNNSWATMRRQLLERNNAAASH